MVTFQKSSLTAPTPLMVRFQESTLTALGRLFVRFQKSSLTALKRPMVRFQKSSLTTLRLDGGPCHESGAPRVDRGDTCSFLRGGAGRSDGDFGYASGAPKLGRRKTFALLGRRWSVGRSSWPCGRGSQAWQEAKRSHS